MAKLSSSASDSGCRGSFEHLCHACQLGRHVRLPFLTSSSRATSIFDLIHCDVWTSPVISISGYKYYLLILDDFSHYLWTFPIRQKSDTFPTLSHFFAWVSTQFGRTIRSIQCVNDREFYNNASRDFFLSRGIHLRMSCPYTSPQNGRAERMIRTANDVTRSLLFQASLPPHYWAEALTTATYLLNRLPTKAVAHPTPYFALFDIHPSYDHLRVFGCSCYPNLASTAPHKLAPRSTRCVFLGYSPDHKGYQCLDLSSHRVLISCHVVFDESDFPFSSSSSTTSLTDLDVSLDLDPVFPTVVPPFPVGPSTAPTRAAPPATLPSAQPRAASAAPASPRATPTALPSLAEPREASASPASPGAAPRCHPPPHSHVRPRRPLRRLTQPRHRPSGPVRLRHLPHCHVRPCRPASPTPSRRTNAAVVVVLRFALAPSPRPIIPSSSIGILATSTGRSPGASGALRAPDRLILSATSSSTLPSVPTTVCGALADPQWRRAMEEEYEAP
jgi:hypothetical protein